MAAKKNAGRYSKRKHKKFMKGQGYSGSDIQYVRSASGPRAKRAVKRRATKNPTVYDAAGKSLGKFTRKAAKIVARVVGGTVGKPKARNPQTALFKSPSAAKKYAAAHGLKVKSIRKVSKAR